MSNPFHDIHKSNETIILMVSIKARRTWCSMVLLTILDVTLLQNTYLFGNITLLHYWKINFLNQIFLNEIQVWYFLVIYKYKSSKCQFTQEHFHYYQFSMCKLQQGRSVEYQIFKHSGQGETKGKAPLFLVSKKNFNPSSWHI